jgi:2-polyprenyl-3-methyl-5-hydroxy-6-metoxy-1,4-benzoquinol methylase
MHRRFKYREGQFDNMSRRSTQRAIEFLASAGELRPYDCVICGSESFEEISEVDRYGFPYPTGICRGCGNIQQHLYYSEQGIATLYSTYYRDIYGEQEPAALFRQQQQSGREIHAFVMANGGAGVRSVLEIGTGAGGILSAFREKGFAVKGLDFDERYIAMGRSQGVTINRGGLESLSAVEKFDLIIMNHVLEHIVDVKQLMADVAEHLTDNGMFYIEVPSIESIPSSYRGNLLIYYQNAHFVHFTRQSFANLLAVTGYEAVANEGAISAIVRHTGRKGPIVPDYAGSRKMIDDLERRYATIRHQVPTVARRIIRKSMERTGLRKAINALKAG